MEVQEIKISTDIKLNLLFAFDQATHNTGFSIWNKEAKELLGYGSIEIKKGNSNERINKLKNILNELYTKCKYHNIEFIFEEIQYQEEFEEKNTINFNTSKNNNINNIKTFKTLAWLQGVLLDWCFENNIKYQLIYSSSWKSYCHIKGQQRSIQKQNSINFVKEKFNIEVNSDEADAICLGWTALNK